MEYYSRFALYFLFASCTIATAIKQDPKGYILYCPCMGRFGNQMDHFLGSFGFAKNLDRTLVVPPWIEYRSGTSNTKHVPFTKYFKLEALQSYHRIIDMETFMKELAPKLWPEKERSVLCYMARNGPEKDSCNAKDGSPFGPFWDNFNINFVKSEFYGPDLYFASENNYDKKKWLERFSYKKYPVMAFTGAPAQFPVVKHYIPIQKYVEFSDEISKLAKEFINKYLEKPYIGVHLRNDIDFKNACEHVEEGGSNFFSSAQCLGYDQQHGKISKELCFPSKKTILKQVEEAVKKTKAKSLFVAADKDHMINEFRKHLKQYKVNVVKYTSNYPQVDLAILSSSDLYIANCVSSFSAFTVRHRSVRNLPTQFWAFSKSPSHDEL
ncbi:DgyrCDS7612 [Dimorphilus gyrociliatus]|uniref:GDP-fucose protein O-fucosyltransferase 1 n=1 Tax=Dimorphilus gyrociliatus TaxID=2664684 RepID=A0A7I8VT87_9ANNE|nr:DgyrCDS7612 [Dimorphilus gyrociliatus]